MANGLATIGPLLPFVAALRTQQLPFFITAPNDVYLRLGPADAHQSLPRKLIIE